MMISQDNNTPEFRPIVVAYNVAWASIDLLNLSIVKVWLEQSHDEESLKGLLSKTNKRESVSVK